MMFTRGNRVRVIRRDGAYRRVPFLRTGIILTDNRADENLVLHDSGETYGWGAREMVPWVPPLWYPAFVRCWRAWRAAKWCLRRCGSAVLGVFR